MVTMVTTVLTYADRDVKEVPAESTTARVPANQAGTRQCVTQVWKFNGTISSNRVSFVKSTAKTRRSST